MHSWEERNITNRMNDMQEWILTKKLINMLHWKELWILNTFKKLYKCESKKLMDKNSEQ